MKQMSSKKWFIKCLLTIIVLLFFTALTVIITDPYFHYHKPLPFLSYRLYEERYTNDGISRHFDFDGLITGTSMAQNFKASEMDALFGTRSVKETFSGAGYQELSDNLDRALSRNAGLHTVLWALDYNGLLRSYDWKQYEAYPAYLYDGNPFNDVSYLFNKSIFYHGVMPCITRTLSGQPGTTMDEYSSWQRETGLEFILHSYDRNGLDRKESKEFGEKEFQTVTKTITENVTAIANKYPDTTFYIFYSPYSICYWDALNIKGTMDKELSAEQAATELMLECPNIRLYNFFDQYGLICDLDNYCDVGHYAPEVNSRILEWIRQGTGLVTKENYLEKIEKEREFFSNYDYDGIYGQ